MKYLLHNYCIYSCLLMIAMSQPAKSQTYLSSEIKGAHLAFNEIGGVQISSDVQIHINKNIIRIGGFLIYATGNRDFNYQENQTYTFVDGANRDKYPLPGLIPGLPEDVYIKVLGLNTAKIIDNGFSVSFGRRIIANERIDFTANLGVSFSWIEESSIVYAFQGDLTNSIATVEDVNLVVPFTQSFFDIGPQFKTELYFIGKKRLAVGISGEIVWLTKTGYKYSFGPSVRVKI